MQKAPAPCGHSPRACESPNAPALDNGHNLIIPPYKLDPTLTCPPPRPRHDSRFPSIHHQLGPNHHLLLPQPFPLAPRLTQHLALLQTLHQPIHTPQSHIPDRLEYFRSIEGLHCVIQRSNPGGEEQVEWGVEGDERVVDDDRGWESGVVDSDLVAFFRCIPCVSI